MRCVCRIPAPILCCSLPKVLIAVPVVVSPDRCAQRLGAEVRPMSKEKCGSPAGEGGLGGGNALCQSVFVAAPCVQK